MVKVLPRAEEAIAGTLCGEKRKQAFRNSTDEVAKATKTKQESYAKTTTSNVMLPPQMRGKKNVVTEDLEKMGLKVKRTQKKQVLGTVSTTCTKSGKPANASVTHHESEIK